MLQCYFVVCQELTINEFLEVNKDSARIQGAIENTNFSKLAKSKFEQTVKFEAVGQPPN